MKKEDLEFALMLEESFKSGVRKARAEHFAKGLPVVYMKNGKIHHEYPPGKSKHSSPSHST